MIKKEFEVVFNANRSVVSIHRLFHNTQLLFSELKHILAQHKEEKKKKTPSNWMAEIEVPLGMKYVLSRVLTPYPV